MLSIIHLGLFFGVALLVGLFYLKTEVIISNKSADEEITRYIFPLLGLAGILASKYVFNSKMGLLKRQHSLPQMLSGYMAACLMRYALVELPAFLNIIWFSKTGDMLYFAVALALVVYLLWLRPTKTKIENDLALKGELLAQFRKEDLSER